jgi:peptide deformylase
MSLELVKFNDPILKKMSNLFPFNDPPFDPVEFSQELVKTMYDKNAINLTATQVGVPYRIFAMRGSPQNFVCFNPKLVQPSIESISLEETCVTYPGMSIKIKRPQHCRVRFATPNGDIRTETFTGMTARVFQNSLDILDGLAYYAKANPIHREIALRKWKLLNF